jgi:hypothetical protein
MSEAKSRTVETSLTLRDPRRYAIRDPQGPLVNAIRQTRNPLHEERALKRALVLLAESLATREDAILDDILLSAKDASDYNQMFRLFTYAACRNVDSPMLGGLTSVVFAIPLTVHPEEWPLDALPQTDWLDFGRLRNWLTAEGAVPAGGQLELLPYLFQLSDLDSVSWSTWHSLASLMAQHPRDALENLRVAPTRFAPVENYSAQTRIILGTFTAYPDTTRAFVVSSADDEGRLGRSLVEELRAQMGAGEGIKIVALAPQLATAALRAGQSMSNFAQFDCMVNLAYDNPDERWHFKAETSVDENGEGHVCFSMASVKMKWTLSKGDLWNVQTNHWRSLLMNLPVPYLRTQLGLGRTGNNEIVPGPKLWAAMVAEFRNWVIEDDFDGKFQHFHQDSAGCSSIREFLRELDALASAQSDMFETHPLSDTERPLYEVLMRPLRLSKDTQHRAEVLVLDRVCIPAVNRLLREVSIVSTQDTVAQAALKAWEAENGVTSWEELEDKLCEKATRAKIGLRLLEVFWAQTGKSKTLREYFSKEAGETGYRAWWPEAFTGIGEPLADHMSQVPNGSTRIRVTRYDEDDVGSSVTPYEWIAELRYDEGSELPDAVACGMVYVLPRRNGRPTCAQSELRWASDAVSDTDVSQMMAFLRQTPDVQSLMQLGDLCFLWIWERRKGSTSGTGRQCLEVALKDLKKRFRKLETLVVSVEPTQFKAWEDTEDPAQIQGEKRLALKQLQALFGQLQPQRWLSNKAQLRLTDSRSLSPGEAMLALGLADVLEGEDRGEMD